MSRKKAASTNDSGGKTPRKEIDAKEIQGLKYFRILRPFLERLHSVGTDRDRANNRQLHMDQYCMLVLLWLYSPIIEQWGHSILCRTLAAPGMSCSNATSQGIRGLKGY